MIHAEEVEIGAAFTTAGDLALNPRRGKSDEVDFDLSEALLLKDTVVTHNHPTGFPFSHGDMELAVERDIAELRAVLPSGVCLSISRPPEGWPPSDKMMEAALTAITAIRDEASRREEGGLPQASEKQNIKVAIAAQKKALSNLGVSFKLSDVWRVE